MADDMLIHFDSPLNTPAAPRRTGGMKSPLIPCPTLPFDIVAENAALEADPFEKVLKFALRQTPAKAVSLPGSPISPKHVRGLPTESELDISAALAERCLVSSTPNPTAPASQKCLPTSDSTPGTPTRRYNSRQGSLASTPRRSVINSIMDMSADHLKLVVQKKMERLQAINQNLPSAGHSNLRRSLSTSDLPKGLRMQPAATEYFSASRDFSVNEITYKKHGMSIINESARSLGDCTYQLTPIKMISLKKEALKLSSIFQNITVDLDYGSDDSLGTPVKKKAKRRHSRSLFTDKCPDSPDDLRAERPPWEWSGSSSEDEDGLPKIMRLRVSAKKEPIQSPGTASLLTRYQRTKSSLKFDDCEEPEVPPQPRPDGKMDNDGGLNSSSTVVAAKAPKPVPSVFVTAPAVIPQPPLPEISVTELKPKTATTNIVKKGPLKAMMPLPNMMKAVLPSKVQVSKARSSSVSSTSSSILKPGSRDKGLPSPVRRSNSSSSLIRKQSNPNKSPLKQKSSGIKPDMRPSTAPSPCKGVLETRSVESAAKGKGSLLKRRPIVAPGKENLIKK